MSQNRGIAQPRSYLLSSRCAVAMAAKYTGGRSSTVVLSYPALGIGNWVDLSTDGSNVTFELGNVGEVAYLTGSVGRAGRGQSVHEGLVVGNDMEFRSLEKESETNTSVKRMRPAAKLH